MVVSSPFALLYHAAAINPAKAIPNQVQELKLTLDETTQPIPKASSVF